MVPGMLLREPMDSGMEPNAWDEVGKKRGRLAWTWPTRDMLTSSVPSWSK
jgi:hypothetical protein